MNVRCRTSQGGMSWQLTGDFQRDTQVLEGLADLVEDGTWWCDEEPFMAEQWKWKGEIVEA